MTTKKRKFKTGEITELVFNAIADSLIQFKSYPGPSLPRIIGLLMKYILVKRKEKLNKRQIKRVMQNLEKRKLIKIEEIGEKVIVELEDSGKPLIMKHSIKNILDFKMKNKKWNKKWYLVFFDVPEIQRNKRDYLRRYLRKLGFFPYQKSVYLFPYECEDEIKLIKQIVEGAKYMKYIVADRIEDENLVKKFFSI